MANALIHGTEVRGFRLMDSKFPGMDSVTFKRFDAGQQIAFLSQSHLSADEKALIFPKGKIYNVTLIWPPLPNTAVQIADDTKAPSEEKRTSYQVSDRPSAKPSKVEETVHGIPEVPTIAPTTFTPSSFQNNIWDVLLNTDNHILIKALAGSGKTSTLVWLVKELAKLKRLVGKKVIYLAFNKSIAEELTEKLQGTGVPALTTHSFGLRCLNAAFGGRIEPQPGGRCTKDAFDRCVCDDNGLRYNAESFKAVRRCVEYALRGPVLELIGYIKSWAICPKFDGGWGFDVQQEAAIVELIQMYEIEFPTMEYTPEDIMRYATRVLIKGLPERGQAITKCDFDDMLYLPICLNLPVEKYDLVLTDESQDFNSCQIQLLGRLIS